MTNSPFTAAEFTRRHAAVRDRMDQENLDAILGYSNAKAKGVVWWLSNYSVRFTGAQTRKDGSYFQFGSCALLFPRDGDPILVTDQPWDIERARELSVFGDTRYAENFGTELGEIVAERGYERVAIDNWFLFPAMHYLPLAERSPGTAYVKSMLVEDTYRIKSPDEIEIIRQAERVAVQAVEVGLAAVDVGVSEYEFALAADHALRTYGELEVAGGCIVAGGTRTASGSGLPTHHDNYIMERGDWALFDICPSWAGFAGDISRMIVAGKPSDLDPHLRRMYETTLRMNEAVIAAVRPGVTPIELNKIAEQIADENGFLDQKIDLLGHSLGPDIHDPPDYYYDDHPLEERMTITVEPCLLERGVAGTRIEDVVLVTADGCENLSAGSPKHLRGSEA